MDVKTFLNLAPRLPCHISVLIRGETGIGKSHITRTVAETLGLPLVDVRGSTMDESKVTGIPDFIASKELGVSTFVLPSWFVRACREPVLLFLDELNRSMPQVQQAFFQVVLDRSLGNDARGMPMTLHPKTRIYAAVNVGSSYDVNDMDPALQRRFWTIDLDTTLEDWVPWARHTGLDPVLIEFLQQNPSHFKVNPASVTPGTICPNGASWHRAADSLLHMGLAASDHMGERPAGSYETMHGFVGAEAAIAYVEFVARYAKQIKAEDIMEGKVSAAKIKKLPASESLIVIDKLCSWLAILDSSGAHMNCWTDKQADNCIAFAELLPEEQLVHFWTEVSKTKNMGAVKLMHPRIGQKIVKLIQAAQNLSQKK
jgi:hypothetical protein